MRRLGVAILLCVCCLATATFAADIEQVRAWLMAEHALARQDKLPACIDISWTVRNLPRMSDEEFHQRLEAIANKPDHPDQIWVRQEAGLRYQEVVESWRVLAQDSDTIRVS